MTDPKCKDDLLSHFLEKFEIFEAFVGRHLNLSFPLLLDDLFCSLSRFFRFLLSLFRGLFGGLLALLAGIFDWGRIITGLGLMMFAVPNEI
jgi:hypothetical protein